MAHELIANDALYAAPEFIGYSLWLVPDASVETKLHGVVEELAARLETPPFMPHATLLGAVVGLDVEQVTEHTKRVAEGLRAIDAEISVVSSKVLSATGKIEYSEWPLTHVRNAMAQDLLYFQCVFGLLKLSDHLRNAHRFAMQIFGRTEEPEFMPHISLVYGDLSSADRRALAQELGPRLDGLKMTMEKLQVWNTTGPVKNWRLIAEFPLLNSQNSLKT